MVKDRFGDVSVSMHGHIARLEIHRPPDNFFDVVLIESLADAFAELDQVDDCRVLVLASEGKCFCAGGDLTGSDPRTQGRALEPEAEENPLYVAASRLFANTKPVIAEVQGPAIGGGLGLAVMADFRIAAHEARFAANFVKLGLHAGFGLSLTLPRLIGVQNAGAMLLTGRRIKADVALAWGLVDDVVPLKQLRDATMKLAAEIAEGAPLAVRSTRATHRQGLAEAVRQACRHEFAEQLRLAKTEDHEEGLRAVAERRPGNFTGH